MMPALWLVVQVLALCLPDILENGQMRHPTTTAVAGAPLAGRVSRSPAGSWLSGAVTVSSLRRSSRKAVLVLASVCSTGCFADPVSTADQSSLAVANAVRRRTPRRWAVPHTPTPPVDTVTPAPPPDTTQPPVVPGQQGCGLAAAAFCETFDGISTNRGRAGDLDIARWSTSRTNGGLPSASGAAFAVGGATMGTCRANLPAQVFVPNDLSICDSNTAIRSSHLAVAVGAQNYGQTSSRIRQPFDFAGRTGRIVFDAEGFFTSPLHGWFSIAITEDPAPSPNFVYTASNDEGGALPRNAIEVHFQRGCGPNTVGVRFVGIFREHVMTPIDASNSGCVSVAEGRLNRFEIQVSQSRLVIRGTNSSGDGSTFGSMTTLFETNISVPFNVGYVQLSTHNHATRKYTPGFGSATFRDAWVTRWDNVGFDGPVRNQTREYEIADSRVPGADASNQPGPVINVGYRVPDEQTGPRDVLTFRNVNVAGMTTARLALATWFLALPDWYPGPLENAALLYRFNGGAWRERRFNTAELMLLRTQNASGQLTQMIDVPISALVSGNNTLEFTTRGVAQQYAPLVSAIDLILAP
jgi:hypothetical protein